MNSQNKYTKVLIIYNSCINKSDQTGVSLRQWFADWPKENLAQIYSGGEVGDERFCKFNFKLGETDRRFGNLFFKLKGSSIGQISYPISLDKNLSESNKFNFWSLSKNKISKLLINTGLWEFIFKPMISKKMTKFIEEFEPQIIYCQGHLLAFAWLPIIINKRFNIPICFHSVDDWPSYLYKSSPISIIIRPFVNKAVKSLLLRSSARLTIGAIMTKEYQKRYGMSFETLMQCDNLNRFQNAIPRRVIDESTISIVYSGSLGLGRWISIIELCEAAKLLQLEGFKIMVTAFATTIPSEAVNKLLKIDNLQILPGPSHDELPCYLKGADILYLPEKFDNVQAEEIRLSISTKAHIYMMSEKPILVYAPPLTGIMNYAMEEGWAYTADEQNLSKLTQALKKLITDNDYCKILINKGIEVVSKNHDEQRVKAHFLTILNDAIKD